MEIGMSRWVGREGVETKLAFQSRLYYETAA